MLRGSENCSSRWSKPRCSENIHLHVTGKDLADGVTCTVHTSTYKTHTYRNRHTNTPVQPPKESKASSAVYTLTMEQDRSDKAMLMDCPV